MEGEAEAALFELPGLFVDAVEDAELIPEVVGKGVVEEAQETAACFPKISVHSEACKSILSIINKNK